MRSAHKRHTIFKYRGQEKRDRRSSVTFSSVRRLFRVGRSSTKVEGGNNEAGSLCPKARICSRHVPQHVSHTRCHIRCSLHTYLRNCVSHAGCSQANPTRLDCVSSEPTNTRSTECVCVCLFQYQRKRHVSCTGRPHDSILPIPSSKSNRRKEERKIILVPRANRSFSYTVRPLSFHEPPLFFSFDRALARSPYLNSFRFVVSFPFVVFLFADLRFVLPLVSHDSLTLSSSTPNSRIAPL